MAGTTPARSAVPIASAHVKSRIRPSGAGAHRERVVRRRKESEQRIGAPTRDEEAEAGAGGREHEALSQQQSDDLRTIAPDRQAQRDLTLSCGAAGDEQVGDVGADDEQHAAGDRHQNQQRLGDLRPKTRVSARRIVHA